MFNVLRKLVKLLLIVVVGQFLTTYIAQNMSKDAELGALIIVPFVLLTGMFIQLIIIFISIKGNITGKIIYTLLGLLMSIIVIWVYGLADNFVRRKEINQQLLKNQATSYCHNQKDKFYQESGLVNLDPSDPKRAQMLQQSDQQFKDCMKKLVL